jgi:hypothetical protein
MDWQPIETAPRDTTILAWAPLWRSPFPAKYYGDGGFVWVDTCEVEARGRREYATLWTPMPLPTPPETGT